MELDLYLKKKLEKMNEQTKEREIKRRREKTESTIISCHYDKQCILAYRQSGKDLSSNFNRKAAFSA